MRAPRHILMTVDAVGGVWSYALDLATALTARRIAVTLAVLGPAPSAEQRRAAERTADAVLVDTDLPLDWMVKSLSEIARAAERIATFAATRHADLVHLNSPMLAALATFDTPKVGVCHSCLATWWDAVRGGGMPDSFQRRTQMLADGYMNCDALVAPSEAFARSTAARYRVRPLVVHNGRALSVRCQPSAGKQPFVLTSGRLWDDGKNIATLEKAAGSMRGRVQAAGALRGPHGESIRLAHVVPLGRFDEPTLREALECAAVFAAPSLYEPFGLGVLEAAQAGCALVLSDIATFRELWQGAAAFVAPRDDTAWARTLDTLLEDPDRCATLGELARARAARFTPASMLGGMLEVYAAALSARPAIPGVAA